MKLKRRHGCLTAWLIYFSLVNTVMALVSFVRPNEIPDVSENAVLAYGAVSIFNLLFLILVFKWLKYGFWGYAITSVAGAAIAAFCLHDAFQTVFALLGLLGVYGLLRLKKADVSGWHNLE